MPLSYNEREGTATHLVSRVVLGCCACDPSKLAKNGFGKVFFLDMAHRNNLCLYRLDNIVYPFEYKRNRGLAGIYSQPAVAVARRYPLVAGLVQQTGAECLEYSA